MMKEDFVSGAIRDRIVAAAVQLIESEGPEAATTRAVAEAAGVQPPTIYRLFGDKRGLLEAAAEATLAAFVAAKARHVRRDDPVADLRQGWDDYMAFSLAHPAVFALMSSIEGPPSPSAVAGLAVLRERVRRIAAAGRLRISEERAVDLIHATGVGVVMTVLRRPDHERHAVIEDAYEAVLKTILVSRDSRLVPSRVAPFASGLRSRLTDIGGLTPGERMLLDELLHRIADQRDEG